MRELKFRQPVYVNGEFKRFVGWGFFNNSFQCPITGDSVPGAKKAERESQQYTGRHDREDKEVYHGDLLQIKLPEIINEGQNGGTYEPSWPSETISPEKIIIAEVIISNKGNISAIVRKISFPNDDWSEDIPNLDIDDESDIKRYKCAKIGTRLKIRKNDLIIGNLTENPEILDK